MPVGLGEPPESRRRGFLAPIDDMVSFLHGGGVLSKGCFWRIDSNEPIPTAASTFNYCWDALHIASRIPLFLRERVAAGSLSAQSTTMRRDSARRSLRRSITESCSMLPQAFIWAL